MVLPRFSQASVPSGRRSWLPRMPGTMTVPGREGSWREARISFGSSGRRGRIDAASTAPAPPARTPARNGHTRLSSRRAMAGAVEPPSSVSTTPKMPFVYLLRCCDGSLYAGAAKDVKARLREHQRGRASRYTRSRLPVALAWSREVATWSEALREEHRTKRLTRQAKRELVARARRARRRGRVARAEARTRRRKAGR